MGIILTEEQLAQMRAHGSKVLRDSGPARMPGERPADVPRGRVVELQRAAEAVVYPVHLWLEQQVKGKARPRAFVDGAGVIRTRKPAAYARWLRTARASLAAQWGVRPTLARASVRVTFWGGNTANDGDNGIGSVMDALVKAGVLKDDALRNVPRGAWEWQAAETPRIEIWIDEATNSA